MNRFCTVDSTWCVTGEVKLDDIVLYRSENISLIGVEGVHPDGVTLTRSSPDDGVCSLTVRVIASLNIAVEAIDVLCNARYMEVYSIKSGEYVSTERGERVDDVMEYSSKLYMIQKSLDDRASGFTLRASGPKFDMERVRSMMGDTEMPPQAMQLFAAMVMKQKEREEKEKQMSSSFSAVLSSLPTLQSPTKSVNDLRHPGNVQTLADLFTQLRMCGGSLDSSSTTTNNRPTPHINHFISDLQRGIMTCDSINMDVGRDEKPVDGSITNNDRLLSLTSTNVVTNGLHNTDSRLDAVLCSDNVHPSTGEGLRDDDYYILEQRMTERFTAMESRVFDEIRRVESRIMIKLDRIIGSLLPMSASAAHSSTYDSNNDTNNLDDNTERHLVGDDYRLYQTADIKTSEDYLQLD